jgi:hypothetical protein
MQTMYNRRNFIRLGTGVVTAVAAAGSVSAAPFISTKTPQFAGASFRQQVSAGLRVGIIGLDVSHSVAFTKLLNTENAPADYGGYKVVAAYPQGSHDISFSVDRIPEFTKTVSAMGVEIVSSVDDLISKVDVVLLNTNDGRLHLEQVLPVLKAGKRVFINKPMAASLEDLKAIFVASKKYNVPVFSSSSMRYMENKTALLSVQTGNILGVDTYSPATIEHTHPDLYWYGIHGVEMLFTLMGKGCKEVRRIYTPDADIVTGTWIDNRIGTFRGTRKGPHQYGGTVFGEKAVVPIVPAKGFAGLMTEIVHYFQTGVSPVSPEETFEIYAFMQAADESRKLGGAAVALANSYKL